MKHYIGIKMLQAKPLNLGVYNKYRGWTIPENEDPERPGYLVRYGDDYESWSPKEVFEAAYLCMGDDPTSVSQGMVDTFRGEVTTNSVDEKTTLVKSKMISGFVKYEVSSCVDPKNYDEEIGKEICVDRINNKIWELLGFVLQWGKNGLNV